MDVQERVQTDVPFRNRLVAWLAANGVDADYVPWRERPPVVGGRLTVRLYGTRGEPGRRQLDPTRTDEMLTHTVTLPVLVEPDSDVAEWLIPPCSSCGR